MWIWIYGQWLNEEWCSVVSDSLQPHELHSPWNSPGQNTGVGSLPLLQGIFPTEGSKPGLPHCRQILYQLSHKGNPINCVESHFPPRFHSGFERENVAQLFPTLCDSMDYTVHGVLQARILEWVAIPFSRGLSQPRDQTWVSLTADVFFTIWATR